MLYLQYHILWLSRENERAQDAPEQAVFTPLKNFLTFSKFMLDISRPIGYNNLRQQEPTEKNTA